jgi:hypothetical protein
MPVVFVSGHKQHCTDNKQWLIMSVIENGISSASEILLLFQSKWALMWVWMIFHGVPW